MGDIAWIFAKLKDKDKPKALRLISYHFGDGYVGKQPAWRSSVKKIIWKKTWIGALAVTILLE